MEAPVSTGCRYGFSRPAPFSQRFYSRYTVRNGEAWPRREVESERRRSFLAWRLRIEGDEPDDLGLRVVALHYSGIAQKLRQPVLAAALLGGYVVPDEIGFPIAVWESQFGPLAGKRFVGGYYPAEGRALPLTQHGDKMQFVTTDLFRLDAGDAIFFGVEESIFEQITMLARKGPRAAAEVRIFEEIRPFYSGISILRDGSIMSPIEFFSPVGVARY